MSPEHLYLNVERRYRALTEARSRELLTLNPSCSPSLHQPTQLQQDSMKATQCLVALAVVLAAASVAGGWR
jgi:hypothetical protein